MFNQIKKEHKKRLKRAYKLGSELNLKGNKMIKFLEEGKRMSLEELKKLTK